MAEALTKKEAAVSLSKARASMYRFLGGLYIMEVDKDQLALLKQLSFPEVEGTDDADQDLREGYRLMSRYLEGTAEDGLEDLAADYAKVFLAAGEAAGRAAFPYESVYVDRRHRVGGSTEMQMHALYKERGLESDPDVYRTMDDNIGLMLEYQANVCDELTQALEAEDREKAGALLKEQEAFVKKHLANWVYSFTTDIVRYADLDFYKGLARITNGFIRKEAELLEKGSGAWDIG